MPLGMYDLANRDRCQSILARKVIYRCSRSEICEYLAIPVRISLQHARPPTDRLSRGLEGQLKNNVRVWRKADLTIETMPTISNLAAECDGMAGMSLPSALCLIPAGGMGCGTREEELAA